MLTKNQLKILEIFRKNIFLETNMRKLVKISKSKSYQRIYEAVKELEKNKILNLRKIGNSNLSSLNLSNRSISLLSFLDEQESFSKNIPNSEKIKSLKQISQYLIMITGSYAKNTQTKNSDLDLIIVIPDNEKAINIQKLIENLTLFFRPKIHLYVFNNRDFIEMLLDKKENYGKEIYKNHIIIKNAYIYYELLKEAIENGFSSKNIS